MLVTDPPYNVAYEGKAGSIRNDSMNSNEFMIFLSSAFEAVADSLKSGAAFYVWYASKEHINFETALAAAGLETRQQLIWVKSQLVLGRHDYHYRHEPCLYGWKRGAGHRWYSDRKQTTVLEFDKPMKSELHPTMKPVELIGYQIGNSSKAGDWVIDIFGGSGSTLIACEQMGRNCLTVELDEKYASVILKRYEDLTGEKAERVA